MKLENSGKANGRNHLTFLEKQAILKKYDNLPDKMKGYKKAECLGINRTTLRSILHARKKIMSHKNPAMKHTRHSKEEEVGRLTLWWLRSARGNGGKVTLSAIHRKASEIAMDMGKNFSPSR